ncbi:hypothetical protein niasHS_013075 [Heterodera schachtii]|uniref:Uncharacterized protein n=1 Tax=Heterodera schachtii TaxID=97005 RepID=A0ABD2I8S2_HETSC
MENSLSPSSTPLNPIIVSSLPPDTHGLTTNSGTPNSPPICTEPTPGTDISPSNCDHPLALIIAHHLVLILPNTPNILHKLTPTSTTPRVITGVVGHTKGKQIHTFKPKCQITQSHPSRTPTVHSKLGNASLATLMHNHTSQTPARGQPMMVNRTRIMDSGRIEQLSSVKEWKEFAKLGKPVPLNQIRFTTPPCPIPPFLAVSSNSPIDATNTPPGVSRTANNFPNLVSQNRV